MLIQRLSTNREIIQTKTLKSRLECWVNPGYVSVTSLTFLVVEIVVVLVIHRP